MAVIQKDPRLADLEYAEALFGQVQKQLQPSGLRDRLEAWVTNSEQECGTCDHYLVNHNADGPCAVGEGATYGCDCREGILIPRRWTILRRIRSIEWEPGARRVLASTPFWGIVISLLLLWRP